MEMDKAHVIINSRGMSTSEHAAGSWMVGSARRDSGRGLCAPLPAGLPTDGEEDGGLGESGGSVAPAA